MLAEFRVHFQSTYIVETCNSSGCFKKLINTIPIMELTSETYIYNSAINYKSNASVEEWNTCFILMCLDSSLTRRIVFRTSLFKGDSSTPLCLRIFFFALWTIFVTDNLWIGTGAGSVSFDKAWVISATSIK